MTRFSNTVNIDGRKLYDAITVRGYNYSTAGDLIGLSPSALSHVIRRGSISFVMLKALCGSLGVSDKEFITAEPIPYVQMRRVSAEPDKGSTNVSDKLDQIIRQNDELLRTLGAILACIQGW